MTKLGPYHGSEAQQEFVRLVVQVWGERWRVPCRNALMVDEDTVDRWRDGRTRVPGPAIAYLRLKVETERRRVQQRKAERTYKKRVRGGA